jgi:ankyrin repeat protein
VVDALIQGGAEKDVADEGGETPVSVSSERGHEDVVALLLDSGFLGRDHAAFSVVLQLEAKRWAGA